MQYQYLAVNTANKKLSGKITADTKADAITKLQNDGLVALKLSTAEDLDNDVMTKQIGGTSDIHTHKVPKKKLLNIMHQMGIMMRAGVSLPIAMGVLIDSEKTVEVKMILSEINDDLFSGTSISDAFAKFKAFPEIVINVIRSGEANGHLDVAFERCADMLAKEIEMVSKIKGAMAYPTFVLILALCLIVVMTNLVLPSFSQIFESFGSDLPALTKGIMAFSHFMQSWGWLVLIIIVGLIVGYKVMKKKSVSFAYSSDQVILKMPVFGKLLHKSYIARFCRTMSSLIEGGVQIVNAIEISGRVLPNTYMRDQINNVADDVRVGSSINASMKKYPVFEPLLISMMKVGEESGMLYDTMTKMASLYESQTDDEIKHLTNFLEPAMIIVVALIVGVTIISIVQPMFGMYSVIH